MEKLLIDKTPNTPYVEFDPENGKMKLEGRSIPENPGDFYDDLIAWLDNYFSDTDENTVIDFNLEYINSGSSKYLLGLLRMLKKHYNKGASMTINWFYEEDDEAILSLGEHYKNTINIPFNLVEYI